jgi:AAA+ ATPase superfamily predicted ATPase
MSTAANNPYDFNNPITNGRLFFGRADVFQWLEEQLQTPAEPIVLYGSERIGKTSLLREIERGRLGANYLTIYVDVRG